MVFVVASHSMVVEANANPDGTMQRKLNLPKSDLRGKWSSEDQQRALATQEQGGGPNVTRYAVTTTSQSARTREDHTKPGSRQPAALPVMFTRPALTDSSYSGGRSPVMSGGSRSTALTAQPGLFKYDYMDAYEPLTTITERFKSTTERKPIRSYDLPVYKEKKPDLPLFKYTPAIESYYKPKLSALDYRPPPSAVTQPSTALVPYTARKTYLPAYTDRGAARIQSYLDTPVQPRQPASVRTALGRVPSSFRGMPLISATHDRHTREYLQPIVTTEAYRPIGTSFMSEYYTPPIRDYEPPEPPTRYYPRPLPQGTVRSISARPLPQGTVRSISARPLPHTPAGFYRGRRHSLPARPIELDLDDDDEFDFRRRPARRRQEVAQIYDEPAEPILPYSYTPRSYHYPRSRTYEYDYPEYTPTTYYGLRSRAAEARDKLDRHKVMLDRYLPIHMGPESDVGMPSLQRSRATTSSSSTTTSKEYTAPKVVPSYRPVSKPQPKTTEKSSPPARQRPPPRPTMSDARKRAREVLCKTKKDPSYFNY